MFDCTIMRGKTATDYDIYYRVHSQNIGWMGWAKNGESAGTAGYSYRLEGIEIKLVVKGGAAPGPTGNAFQQNLSNLQPAPSPSPNPPINDGVNIIPAGSTFTSAVFNRINEIKEEEGYAKATWSESLASGAQTWAETCAKNKEIKHEGGLMVESIGNGYGTSSNSGTYVGDVLVGHNGALLECKTIGVGGASRSDGFGGVYCVIRGRK